MSLLDHSFHNFDVDLWVNNFEELPEPEYIVQSLDELKFSEESSEVKALLIKDGTYDRIIDVLSKQDMEQLFLWTMYPADFIEDSGITYDNEYYAKFLSEFIPGYVLFRNQWCRNQLGIELRNFIQNMAQPYNRKNSRLKKCRACGYNITDLFASYLTADNVLDNTPVSVVCPHCNVINYIKY